MSITAIWALPRNTRQLPLHIKNNTAGNHPTVCHVDTLQPTAIQYIPSVKMMSAVWNSFQAYNLGGPRLKISTWAEHRKPHHCIKLSEYSIIKYGQAPICSLFIHASNPKTKGKRIQVLIPDQHPKYPHPNSCYQQQPEEHGLTERER